MLAIHLFGQPRFFLDEDPFPFSARPKTLPLLAYLLLHRAGFISRDTLAFTFWADDTETMARTNLRRHLSYLSQALPPAPNGRPWLLSQDQAIQWNPDGEYRLDVAEFERLLPSGGQPERAEEQYAGHWRR